MVQNLYMEYQNNKNGWTHQKNSNPFDLKKIQAIN